MASLQVLVNNLLVWQSSCASKLRPLKTVNIFVQPLVDVQLIIRNIDKWLVHKLFWHVRLTGLYFSWLILWSRMEYSRFQIVDSCQVMQQWIWHKLMLCFLCNGMATTCVYVHA